MKHILQIYTFIFHIAYRKKNRQVTIVLDIQHKGGHLITVAKSQSKSYMSISVIFHLSV